MKYMKKYNIVSYDFYSKFSIIYLLQVSTFQLLSTMRTTLLNNTCKFLL